ncbi:MAG: ComEA family DNA-binding protein [Desulfocapsaceae bacterium]
MLLQLVSAASGEILNRRVEPNEHWDISRVNVLPTYQTQKDVLLSVFQLENIPVNHADVELLTTVSGIGPALAKRIVEERDRSGYYQHPADLVRVRGIGAKRAEQFQSYLRFD